MWSQYHGKKEKWQKKKPRIASGPFWGFIGLAADS
jgi:hypothetical protein